MTARDVIALEASERTAVTLLDSRARTGSGSGDPIQFENLSRVYVRATAKNRTTRHQGAASLTVTVEDSADGSSWSTVATFTFTDSETQAEAVDSPQAYLRVSWSVASGTWAFGADAVLFAAGAADTGGSQPAIAEVLAQGNDAAGATIINLGRLVLDLGSASDSGPTLKLVANFDGEDNNLFEGYNEHGEQVIRADAEGILRAIEGQLQQIILQENAVRPGDVKLSVSPPLAQTADVVTFRSKLGALALLVEADGDVISNTPVALNAGVTVGGNALFSAVGFYGNAAVGQQQLDPATCTPADIANALIASTLIGPV